MSKALTYENVEKFIDEAPDDNYLLTKVALILTATGHFCQQDLIEFTTDDIQNHGEEFVIKIPHTEDRSSASFVIQGKYYQIIKKYHSLRSTKARSHHFFQQFRNGKCRAQLVGKKKFGSMFREIAEYLNLPDPDAYSSGPINVSDSSTRTQPEPSPSEPNRGKQCRFCCDFKDCSPVVQKPYLMGNKTTLALNHVRIELDFSIESLPNTVCRDCDAKLLETIEFIKQVNTAQFSLIAVCPNNATNTNSSANNESTTTTPTNHNNDLQRIEIDSQIIKAKFQSTDEDSRPSEVKEDPFIFNEEETVILRETHKIKHEVDNEKLKKVKKYKSLKKENTGLKEIIVDNNDGNSEDNVVFSNMVTAVKPAAKCCCGLELAASSVEYLKVEQTFSDTRVKAEMIKCEAASSVEYLKVEQTFSDTRVKAEMIKCEKFSD